MPNWCNNRVRIGAPNEIAAASFEREFKAGNLMNSYLPVALDKTAVASRRNLPRWYVDRIAAWGVKWDVDPEGAQLDRHGCDIDCCFDTAWAPPMAFFAHLMGLGYTVDAVWFEPGMMFGGRINHHVQESWSGSDVEFISPDCFPGYLHDAFGQDFMDWYFEDHDDEDAE